MDFQEVTSRWRHRYYKVFPMEDLSGVIRYQLTPAQRGVWYDLRNVAGISENPGCVCQSAGHAYRRADLALVLNIPTALLQSTVDKALELGLCTEDDTGIHILDWPRRQSEYDRQKPYRQKRTEVDPDKFIKGKYGHMIRRK